MFFIGYPYPDVPYEGIWGEMTSREKYFSMGHEESAADALVVTAKR